MKRINKSEPPNTLTLYEALNPQEIWENFRNSNSGADYRSLKKVVFKDQGQLCAFCETKVESVPEKIDLQRIEHFHPKSDDRNTEKNWALDWNNVMGVCLGGSGRDIDARIYPRPNSLSCDAFKDHLVSKNKLSVDCECDLINPLLLGASPCLFAFKKRTGELTPSVPICNEIHIEENRFDTVAELVENTIYVLNLNTHRLNEKRLEVFHEYERLLKKARDKNDINIKKELAERWFSKHCLSFFTTRRILLGTNAEKYLQSVSYFEDT